MSDEMKKTLKLSTNCMVRLTNYKFRFSTMPKTTIFPCGNTDDIKEFSLIIYFYSRGGTSIPPMEGLCSPTRGLLNKIEVSYITLEYFAVITITTINQIISPLAPSFAGPDNTQGVGKWL